jgi:hypothetical protein
MSMNKNPYVKFWQWFSDHSSELLLFEDREEELTKKLTRELRKVHPDLVFAIGPTENGKREFVISANGIQSVFPVVVDLYKEAPEMKQWIVTPFHPRKGAELEVTLEDVTLSSDEVYFTYTIEEDKLGLTLYTETMLEEKVMTILFLFLDNALGEYDVATKIGSVEFAHIATAPENVLEFDKLPMVVDAFFEEEEPLKN